MTSQANTKNMSSMDSSFEQHSGSDSDNGDFSDNGEKRAQVEIKETQRIGAEDLSDGKYKARIMIGDLFCDDDDVGCFWEDAETKDTTIRWGICDLDGNEGICCDEYGNVWPFWDEEQMCYHTEENLTSNDLVYRIISLEKKESKKSKTKKSKTKKSKTKKSKTKKSDKSKTKKSNKKLCDCGALTTEEDYEEHTKSEMHIKNVKVYTDFLKEDETVEDETVEAAAIRETKEEFWDRSAEVEFKNVNIVFAKNMLRDIKKEERSAKRMTFKFKKGDKRL